MSDVTIRAAFFDQIDASSLYKILKLRSQVYVVEQECIFLDLDDRDQDPDCLQMWIEENGDVVANLRVLQQPDKTVKISRVCTAQGARGRGLATLLINDVIENETGGIVIDPQTQLERWFVGMGFSVAGPEFMEAGIPHVPMALRR